MSSVVIPVGEESPTAVAQLATRSLFPGTSKVLLLFQGRLGLDPITLRTLDYFTALYASLDETHSCTSLVPLLPSLGWTAERLALRADLGGVRPFSSPSALRAGGELVREINAIRRAGDGGLPQLELLDAMQGVTTRLPHTNGQAGPDDAPATQCRVLYEEWGRGELKFRKVAVGGTFDRLHAGHRLLLAATAAVAEAEIFVGITSARLLANKKGKELLETYESRTQAAVSFMQGVNPRVRVVAGPLIDPAEPPLATTDASYDAIVVSEETVVGAEAINKDRSALGFPPLTVVVVGLVASRGSGGGKLSSTDLRCGG